jgi:hypothetical protein
MAAAPWVADFLDRHGATIAAEGLGAPTIQRRWGLSLHAARQVAAEARARGVPSRNTRIGLAGYAAPVQPEAVSPGREQPERDDSRPVSGSRPFPGKGNRRETDGPGSVPSAETGAPRRPQEPTGRGDVASSGSVPREEAPRPEGPPGRQRESSVTGPTHLVIGDAHAEPGHDLERFAWLGRLVAHVRPDVVISIGDWADMPSLSAYDVGKRSFEGRRYVADIEAANEALRLFHRNLGDWQGRLVIVYGNHEDRIERACNDNAALDGTISLADLDFGKRGWWQVPYQQSLEIDGVHYSHMVPSGVMNRPIGGEHHAASLIRRRMVSTVVGHSHLLDYAIRTDGAGRRIQGLVCGCYFDAHHSFAGAANALYWRGICVLRNVRAGTYDLETWALERIRQQFGGEP